MSGHADTYPSVPGAGVEPRAREARLPGPHPVGATGGAGTPVGGASTLTSLAAAETPIAPEPTPADLITAPHGPKTER